MDIANGESSPTIRKERDSRAELESVECQAEKLTHSET